MLRWIGDLDAARDIVLVDPDLVRGLDQNQEEPDIDPDLTHIEDTDQDPELVVDLEDPDPGLSEDIADLDLIAIGVDIPFLKTVVLTETQKRIEDLK